jgi:arsenate reductase
VTLADRALGGIATSEALAYGAAQLTGGILGTIVANLMFDLPALEWSHRIRSGSGLWLGEVVATFGLLVVIFGVARSGRSALAPFAVGAYVAAAYFFTASTSFANPAVTVARMFTNTFAGIRPGSVGAFIAFQALGAVLAVATIRTLYPRVAETAPDVVVPHPTEEAA